jgi:hypothetical protein
MLRGLAIWLLIMAIETFSGTLRGIYLVPAVGERTASLIGWPIGALVVLAVTHVLFDWIALRGTASLLTLGVLWAVLTVGFEALIGFARGMTPERILAGFNPLTGGLVVLTAAFMLIAPCLAAKLRGV